MKKERAVVYCTHHILWVRHQLNYKITKSFHVQRPSVTFSLQYTFLKTKHIKAEIMKRQNENTRNYGIFFNKSLTVRKNVIRAQKIL